MEMASDHWTKGMEFGDFEVMSDKFISLRFHWMCVFWQLFTPTTSAEIRRIRTTKQAD